MANENRIVRPRKVANPAPDNLIQRLVSKTADYVVVNAGGEEVDRTPDAIAAFCRSEGVWCDYCGYPFWWRYDPLTDNEDLLQRWGWYDQQLWPPKFSKDGFLDRVVDGWGMGWGNPLKDRLFAASSFFPPPSNTAYYPFRRGFTVQRPAGLPAVTPTLLKDWASIIVNLKAPHVLDNDAPVFSNFAIQVSSPLWWNRGYYFYGAWDGYNGVDPDIYAAFVNDVMKWDQQGSNPNTGLPKRENDDLMDKIKKGVYIGAAVAAGLLIIRGNNWLKGK